MPVPASTRQYLDSHLGQAEFALKIASNFACLQGTPAHEQVRAALAQVAGARLWVKDKLEVEPVRIKPHQAPLGEGLPLSRKERVGYRWP
jgi:hypothetical protein